MPYYKPIRARVILVRKIGGFEKSGVKLQCSTGGGGGGTTFGSSYREVRSRNRDSTVFSLTQGGEAAWASGQLGCRT